MSDDEREEIGQIVDTCENLLCAAKLPIPPTLHVEGLLGGIEGIRIRLQGLIGTQP